MIERGTLIIMAKTPRIGAGKTRLAADIGKLEAWRINRALQARTLREARDPRWRTLMCVTPDADLDLALPRVWPRRVARIAQGEGDLGARMGRALAPHRNVAVIGTDCPAMTRAHIASAFGALKRAPFAIGLAPDGGFWILAARSGAAAARAMQGVRWSSKHAAADVTRNLGLGQAVWLPMLGDIDTIEDWRAYRRARRASSG